MAKFFRDSAANQQTFGAAGFKVIGTGTTVAGDFVAISFLADSTVGSGGIVTTTEDDIASSTAIPAGMTIYGDFTSIKLSAGLAIAYIRALG